MERKEEKRLIEQSDDMHKIIMGTGDEPGLCEMQRALERRVGRLEAGAKWVISIFSTVFVGSCGLIWGVIWHKLFRQ